MTLGTPSPDVARVRAAYPALTDGWAYLDGAGGTQVPQAVIDAVAAAWAAGISNSGGAFPASARAEAHTAAARRAVTDLVGAPSPEGVVLGPNMTTLTYRLAGALERTWALTAASNVAGTRPEVRAVADAAHAVGALVYVDGVHATPHGPVDMRALGADLYATSAYKWSGPHLGAVAADPALLEDLHPDKLASSPAEVPWRFETGTPPFAQHAGLEVERLLEALAGLVGV